MSKKRYLIGGLLYAVLLIFTGCINGNKGQDINIDAINNPVKRSEVMDIYVYSYDVKTINAIDEFNSKSKIKINPTELKDENDAKQYREKIVTSMLAGDGPDIILDNAYWFPALWKKEAFNFIKLLLSEKYQNNETGTKWSPVNIKAYTSIQNQYSGDSGNNKQIANFQINENAPYLSAALSDNTINKLNLYYKNIQKCSYVDTNVLNIINQEVESFLAGKYSASQTAKLINDKVQLYMNE